MMNEEQLVFTFIIAALCLLHSKRPPPTEGLSGLLVESLTVAVRVSGSSAVVGTTVVRSLSVNATTIQSVVNNLTHSRDVWIDIHTIACAQVTQDALGCDIQSRAVQFRETACLDVVNSQNPLV
jgi:hypothetical protein